MPFDAGGTTPSKTPPIRAVSEPSSEVTNLAKKIESFMIYGTQGYHRHVIVPR
ncbi:MAG: hypothetical protein JWP89_323 [Schlesneria sp.]|nr:hypothetical protein [Schlesneria sp.]